MVIPEQRVTTPKDPVEAALRKLLKDLIKQSRKSRANIADDMTPHAGRQVSKRMIDDWVSPKMRARFPAALIEAFSAAIGNDTLQRHVMGAELRGIIDLREEQLASLVNSLRAEFLKPNPRRRLSQAKGKRPAKS